MDTAYNIDGTHVIIEDIKNTMKQKHAEAQQLKQSALTFRCYLWKYNTRPNHIQYKSLSRSRGPKQ